MGKLTTIARVIYSVHDVMRHPIKKGSGEIYLAKVDQLRSINEFTVGLTSHHPNKHAATSIGVHIRTQEIATGRFLTVTYNNYSKRQLLAMLSEHLRPANNSPIRQETFGGDFATSILHYHSYQATFIHWLNCGIREQPLHDWWSRSREYRRLEEHNRNFERIFTNPDFYIEDLFLPYAS